MTTIFHYYPAFVLTQTATEHIQKNNPMTLLIGKGAILSTILFQVNSGVLGIMLNRVCVPGIHFLG